MRIAPIAVPLIFLCALSAAAPSVWAYWVEDGTALCTATASQINPTIALDGSGGAIVTWWDYRSGSNTDVYVQRVNASGAVQWTANGVVLCTATENQQYPTIVSDGSGGAIVTWQDYRSGSNYDIYAQSINARGRPGFLGPTIVAVTDIPGDQGGWARISIEKSVLDDAQELTYPISMYNVWMRIDDPALFEPTPGDILGAGDFPAGTWELLGKFAACQQDHYIFRARTRADSTGGAISYSVYFVSALTTTPSVWYASQPDSGYSADNIAPAAPGGLAGEQIYEPPGLALSWDASAANDLSHYAVYRGLSEGFVPAPENRVATPADPAHFDGDWRWSSGYYYKVSAVDVHGNESGFAMLAPDDVTGTDTPKAPDASYLAQNYPNPFNPRTRIAFGLDHPGRVSLRIYDAAGRLVRVLVDEERRQGRYEEMWDGEDGVGRAVASGIYFCRIVSDGFENTRKMTLLR